MSFGSLIEGEEIVGSEVRGRRERERGKERNVGFISVVSVVSSFPIPFTDSHEKSSEHETMRESRIS